MADVFLVPVGTDAVPEVVRIDSGAVVWVRTPETSIAPPEQAGLIGEMAAGIVAAVQECLSALVVTVVVVSPAPSRGGGSDALERVAVDVAVGITQSVQLELGSAGVRTNVIVCREDQVADLNRTLAYFHGPDGGFVAGCTFDLRPEGTGDSV